VKVASEHASLYAEKTTPTAVEYIVGNPDPEIVAASIDTVNFERERVGRDLGNLIFYTKFHNDDIKMFKRYRPSTFTDTPATDNDKRYFSKHSHSQMLRQLFKESHPEIFKPVREAYRKVLLRAEMFIGRNKFVSDYKSPTVEIDLNSAFVSGHTSPYYQGYPHSLFVPSKNTTDVPQRNLKPAFVIVTGIKLPPALSTAMTSLYDRIPNVLPYPMYKFLVDQGAEITVDTILYARHTVINIPEFAEEYRPKFDPAEFKTARLAIVGGTISGGVKETVTKTFWRLSESEKTQ